MKSAFLFAAIISFASASLGAATLQGVVRDAHGTAVPNAPVQIQPADPSNQPQTVHADANGNYLIASLRAGSYKIRVQMASFAAMTLGPFLLGESETKRVDVVLQPWAASLDFTDEPKFTVAGVKDYTYIGGHGSDTVVRSAEALTRATAGLSKDVPARPSAVNQSEADKHHQAAEVDEKSGNPLDAVREYQRAAELDASEANLFDWGTELLVHSAPEPAIEVFTKGIHLFPRSSRMLLGVAVASYAKGDYDRAARHFFAATDLKPDDPKPYLFLARVQAPEITESDGFRERVARFAKLQPGNAWANYYYAMSILKLGKTAQAQFLLQKSVRLDPQLGVGYLQLGILSSERQDLSGAISAYQKATEVDPGLEQAHYRLAQAYRQKGDMQRAQEETKIFQQLSKASAQQLEHERSDLRQFVITLKNAPANQ
jgi:tetratricopeptide (TPR) repeat protein